jgi:hypothetical protein
MAIQNANFNADSYVKSGSKRVITCTSNQISSNFKYRFYLELIYDSKTYAYTFRPNANGYGLINIGKILQSIVEPTSVQQVLTIPDADSSLTTNSFQQSIHNMPHIINASPDRYAYLSTGGSNCKKIEAKLYDFYSATASAVPSKQGAAVTDNYYVISGYQTSEGLLAETYSLHKLTAITGQFISPLNAKASDITLREFDIDVDLTDYGSVSILNRTEAVNTTADTYQFCIVYYNAASVLASQSFINTADYGGKYNSSGVSDDSMVITFGCYPANLNKLPAAYERPSDHPTLTHYWVFVQPTGAVDSNSRKSALYKFNIIDRCEKYDAQRFAYINSFGVWEYITFDKKRTDKISKTTTEIKTSVFDYTKSYATISPVEYQENTYVPGVAHESRTIKSTESKASFTINTGYLENHDIAKVEEMFLAPKINYINSDGTALAVILTNKNIDSVEVSHKYEQTQYTLTFEYSVPKYNDIIF